MNNFSTRASLVLAEARKVADECNHNYIGTEHVLVALLDTECTANDILTHAKLNITVIRERVLSVMGVPQEQKTDHDIPYTPRVKKVLAGASRTARSLNDSFVGTEHFLIALRAEGDGIAAVVLKEFELDEEKIRSTLFSIREGKSPKAKGMKMSLAAQLALEKELRKEAETEVRKLRHLLEKTSKDLREFAECLSRSS